MYSLLIFSVKVSVGSHQEYDYLTDLVIAFLIYEDSILAPHSCRPPQYSLWLCVLLDKKKDPIGSFFLSLCFLQSIT